MKQSIDLSNESLTPNELDYIISWKMRKYHDLTPTLSIGQVLELIVATTYTFHKDFADTRFFNNILINQESVIGYDGEELIDTLFYELKTLLHKRFSRSETILAKKDQ